VAQDLPPVYMEFKADIKGIQDALKTIEGDLKSFKKGTQSAGQGAKEMSAKTVAAGAIMANVIEHLGEKIFDFAKETLNAFQDVGQEVIKMQRVLGGTAEEMSKLRFAGEEFGITSDQLVTSFKILDKHLVNNDKSAQALGITYRDAAGKILPSTTVLANLADRFAHMSNGAEKTSLAVQAFGRSGVAMIPILNMGRDGLQEMYDNATKLGMTLSGKDLTAVKQYTLNQKELHATIQGVQLGIGRDLIPKLMTLTNVVRDVITQVVDFTKHNQTLTRVVGFSAAAVLGLYGATKLYNGVAAFCGKIVQGVTAAFEALAGAEAASAWEVIGLTALVAGLAAGFIYLYKTFAGFREAVQVYIMIQLKIINIAMNTVIKTVRSLVDAFSDTIITLLAVADKLKWLDPALLAVEKGFGLSFSAMGTHVTNFRNAFDKQVNAASDTASGFLDSAPAKISAGLTKLMNFDVSKYLKSLAKKYKIELPNLPVGAGATTAAAASGSQAKKAMQAMQDAARALDTKFVLAKSEAHTLDQQKAVASAFSKQVGLLVAAARAEEKKTRGTVAHAKAVSLLNSALREQAKIQTYMNGVNDKAAKAAAEAARQQSALNNTMISSQSWLAAHAAGTLQSNVGSVTVPVSIDGREVFRAVQTQATRNSRRNISNGLTFTGAVL
jgi:hypothetical protein